MVGFIVKMFYDDCLHLSMTPADFPFDIGYVVYASEKLNSENVKIAKSER